MPKRAPTFKAILSEVARGDRSSLFCWLVEHHDEVIEQSAGKRMRWEPLCKRFAEHGLTDINGRPATPRTARQAWFQARRAVAEAKKRKQASDAARRPGAVYPSRIPPDWRPTVVPPRPMAPTQQAGASSGAVVPASGQSLIDPSLPPEARAELEKLDRIFTKIESTRLKV
jgi:hypothetical protein